MWGFMRTVSGAANTRAVMRRRAAKARRAAWARSVRQSLWIDHPRGVAGICCALALVLASAWFHSEFVPFGFSWQSVSGSWGERRSERHDSFTQTRVGEIVFTPFDGNACRKVRFSNQTGWFGPDENIRCDTGLDPDSAAVVHSTGARDRLVSIRQAFTTQPAR